MSTRCAPPTRRRASRRSACRSSTTWRRATPRPTSCSAAAARSPSPSWPRSASASIIVPLPGAIADEQSANAQFLVDAGAALDDAAGRAHAGAARRAAGERSTRARLLAMATAARTLARVDAADRVADACVALGARAMKHKVKRVHFVGIGGAGMSGIAEVLATQGYQVSGSDLARERGHARASRGSASPIAIGHAAANVAGADVVVVSTAVAPDNPEVVAAREQRHSGRAARADAGRADAPEAGHRGRRHARQDDDDEPDRVGAGRRRPRSDVRDRRPAPVGGRERAARQGRLPGRRSRRIRRVVPLPDAGARRDHQHRRRSHGNLRPRLRAAEARVRRLRAAAAVLRRRGAVRRRSQRARDPARDHQADRHLRDSPRTRGIRATDVANDGGRMRFVACAAGAPRPRRSSSTCPACTTCGTRSPRSRSAARSASPTRRSPRRSPNSAASAAASSAMASSLRQGAAPTR